MTDNTVISLNASVVCIDVYVELLLVSFNVNLAFGPFAHILDAQVWADELDHIHAKKQLLEIALAEDLFLGDSGMPTRPYVGMHMDVGMIAEHKQARKLSKHLLEPASAGES